MAEAGLELLNRRTVLEQAEAGYVILESTVLGRECINILVQGKNSVPLPAPDTILPGFHTLVFHGFLHLQARLPADQRNGPSGYELMLERLDRETLHQDEDGSPLLEYYIERLVCLDLTCRYRVTEAARAVLAPLVKYLDLYGMKNISLTLECSWGEDIEQLVLSCKAVRGLVFDFDGSSTPVPVQNMPAANITDVFIVSKSDLPWKGEPYCHPRTLCHLHVESRTAPLNSFVQEYMRECCNLRTLSLSFIRSIEPWSMQSLVAPFLEILVVGPAPGLLELPELHAMPLEVLYVVGCPNLREIPPLPPTLDTLRFVGNGGTSSTLPVESMSRCRFRCLTLRKVVVTESMLVDMLAGSRDTLETLVIHPIEFDGDLSGIVPQCRALQQLEVYSTPRIQCGHLAACRNLTKIAAVSCPDFSVDGIEFLLSLLEVYPPSPESNAVVRRNQRLHASAQTILQLLIWQNRLSRIRYRVPDEVWFIIFTRFF